MPRKPRVVKIPPQVPTYEETEAKAKPASETKAEQPVEQQTPEPVIEDPEAEREAQERRIEDAFDKAWKGACELQNAGRTFMGKRNAFVEAFVGFIRSMGEPDLRTWRVSLVGDNREIPNDIPTLFPISGFLRKKLNLSVPSFRSPNPIRGTFNEIVLRAASDRRVMSEADKDILMEGGPDAIEGYDKARGMMISRYALVALAVLDRNEKGDPWLSASHDKVKREYEEWLRTTATGTIAPQYAYDVIHRIRGTGTRTTTVTATPATPSSPPSTPPTGTPPAVRSDIVNRRPNPYGASPGVSTTSTAPTNGTDRPDPYAPRQPIVRDAEIVESPVIVAEEEGEDVDLHLPPVEVIQPVLRPGQSLVPVASEPVSERPEAEIVRFRQALPERHMFSDTIYVTAEPEVAEDLPEEGTLYYRKDPNGRLLVFAWSKTVEVLKLN